MSNPINPSIRRVVTGHDDQGKAIVEIDEVCSHYRQGRPNGFVCNVWTTDTSPANNNGHVDAGRREGKFSVIENGTVFRILDFHPGVQQRVHRHRLGARGRLLDPEGAKARELLGTCIAAAQRQAARRQAVGMPFAECAEVAGA